MLSELGGAYGAENGACSNEFCGITLVLRRRQIIDLSVWQSSNFELRLQVLLRVHMFLLQATGAAIETASLETTAIEWVALLTQAVQVVMDGAYDAVDPRDYVRKQADSAHANVALPYLGLRRPAPRGGAYGT